MGMKKKDKGLPQVTPPPILTNSLVSREEHLTSLDTLKSSMRLEMAAMFEQYLGNKSSGPTNPSTALSVDLTMAEVKPSNNGSTSTENIGAIPRIGQGITVHLLGKVCTNGIIDNAAWCLKLWHIMTSRFGILYLVWRDRTMTSICCSAHRCFPD
jgi:hypothetical protein